MSYDALMAAAVKSIPTFTIAKLIKNTNIFCFPTQLRYLNFWLFYYFGFDILKVNNRYLIGESAHILSLNCMG
jgi:hypothetical protein